MTIRDLLNVSQNLKEIDRIILIMKLHDDKKAALFFLAITILVASVIIINTSSNKDLQKDLERFYNTEFEGNKIIKITEVPYPERGSYKRLRVENKSRSYPLLLDESSPTLSSNLELNAIIKKKSKSYEFQVINETSRHNFVIAKPNSVNHSLDYIITFTIFFSVGGLIILIVPNKFYEKNRDE